MRGTRGKEAGKVYRVQGTVFAYFTATRSEIANSVLLDFAQHSGAARPALANCSQSIAF